MRTTLDLPDELLQEAKIAAVRKHLTLRELVARALTRELSVEEAPEPTKKAKLPIFRSRAPGSLDVTGEDLAALDFREDTRRHGLTH